MHTTSQQPRRAVVDIIILDDDSTPSSASSSTSDHNPGNDNGSDDGDGGGGGDDEGGETNGGGGDTGSGSGGDLGLAVVDLAGWPGPLTGEVMDPGQEFDFTHMEMTEVDHFDRVGPSSSSSDSYSVPCYKLYGRSGWVCDFDPKNPERRRVRVRRQACIVVNLAWMKGRV